MKTEKNTFANFINVYGELKNSLAEIFDNSFHKEIVTGNIKLIDEKRYAITDDIWNIDENQNFKFISLFIELLKSYAKEHIVNIENIERIFNNDVLFSKQFTVNVLQNKHKIVFDFARNNGLSNDFISFFSIFIAYPYRESIADFIKKKIDIKSHVSGYCPICGHWPGISYLSEKDGKKIMACIHCGSYWLFQRVKCSFCLTSDNNVLGYLNIEDEKDVSAYVCNECHRYLKTIRIKDDKISEKWQAVIDYMSSGDIDIAAMQNKYIQEPILNTRFQGPNDPHIELYLNKLQYKLTLD